MVKARCIISCVDALALRCPVLTSAIPRPGRAFPGRGSREARRGIAVGARPREGVCQRRAVQAGPTRRSFHRHPGELGLWRCNIPTMRCHTQDSERNQAETWRIDTEVSCVWVLVATQVAASNLNGNSLFESGFHWNKTEVVLTTMIVSAKLLNGVQC
eukprot:2560874-Rhodomonas_salina.1